MNLNMQMLHVHALLVYPLPKVLRNVLVQFFVNETRDCSFNTVIDLRLDFTEIINQYCGYIEWRLLTFLRKVC